MGEAMLQTARAARVAAFLVVSVGLGGPIRAAEPVEEQSESVEEQTERALEALESGRGSALLHTRFWLAAYGGLTVIQGAAAGLAEELMPDGSPKELRDLRASMLVGSGTSLLGAISVALVTESVDRGRALVDEMPADTVEQREAKLKRAEALLREAAEDQEFRQGWFAHVSSALVNLAGGLILWLAFDDPIDGLIQLLTGTAISEIQIWSTPTGAIEAWDAYRKGQPVQPAPAEAQVRWTVGVMPGGLSAQVLF